MGCDRYFLERETIKEMRPVPAREDPLTAGSLMRRDTFEP